MPTQQHIWQLWYYSTRTKTHIREQRIVTAVPTTFQGQAIESLPKRWKQQKDTWSRKLSKSQRQQKRSLKKKLIQDSHKLYQIKIEAWGHKIEPSIVDVSMTWSNKGGAQRNDQSNTKAANNILTHWSKNIHMGQKDMWGARHTNELGQCWTTGTTFKQCPDRLYVGVRQ